VVQDGSIPCNYRIVQEGLAALLPLMSAQTFRLTVDEFERIVTERSVPVPSPASAVAPSAPGAIGASTPPTAHALDLLGCPILNLVLPLMRRAYDDPPASNTCKHATNTYSGKGAGTTEAAPSEQAATAAGGGAAPSQQPPASAEAGGADAEAVAAPAEAADGSQQAPNGGGQQQKKEGRPRVPLADPITLEQLEAVRPGCCIAILRCLRLAQQQMSQNCIKFFDKSLCQLERANSRHAIVD